MASNCSRVNCRKPSRRCSLDESSVSKRCFASAPASSGCARTSASCSSFFASVIACIIASWSASSERNGRLRQARRATHGECSNTPPKRSTNSRSSSAFTAASSTHASVHSSEMAEARVEASRIMQRCDALARHSELPGGLTRVFLSPESRAAGEALLGWMREAGMQASLDAMGNAVGRYEGTRGGLPCLMLGSHLDTVRDAGRYDGMLGVITAIECVDVLNAQKKRLPFALEVVGFGDEEGVRFGTTLLGSRAVAGNFDFSSLKVKDSNGITMEQALRDFGLAPQSIAQVAKKKGEVLAYAELHIEQGPVLEAEGLPVGVVTAINGFSRLRVTLSGAAGHAGTVPMHLRRDALAAAAECICAVEKNAKTDRELVATVGRIEASPGAINVIPGKVIFTVDVRAPKDDLRLACVAAVQ